MACYVGGKPGGLSGEILIPVWMTPSPTPQKIKTTKKNSTLTILLKIEKCKQFVWLGKAAFKDLGIFLSSFKLVSCSSNGKSFVQSFYSIFSRSLV